MKNVHKKYQEQLLAEGVADDAKLKAIQDNVNTVLQVNVRA